MVELRRCRLTAVLLGSQRFAEDRPGLVPPGWSRSRSGGGEKRSCVAATTNRPERCCAPVSRAWRKASREGLAVGCADLDEQIAGLSPQVAAPAVTRCLRLGRVWPAYRPVNGGDLGDAPPVLRPGSGCGGPVRRVLPCACPSGVGESGARSDARTERRRADQAGSSRPTPRRSGRSSGGPSRLGR